MLKTDINPATVSDVIPFPNVTYERLQELEAPASEPSRSIVGQISEDGTWSYLINGSYLEVTSVLKGDRISSWRFTNSTRNNRSLPITCVKEFVENNVDHSKPKEPKLILGLDNGNHGGLLCLFAIKSSKIMKCIEIPHVVTALEVVSKFGGVNVKNSLLAAELRCMFGAVAVGTEDGHLYLVDLCLDEDVITTPSNPARLFHISPNIDSIYERREDALMRGQHLCLALNEILIDQLYFRLRDRNEKSLVKVLSDKVFISCITYISRLCTLAVGFNFGGFSLWSLNRLIIEENVCDKQQQNAVVTFAYQEPENDPKPFAFLWVGRGVLPSSSHLDIVSTICLYALKYSIKRSIKPIGYYYEHLQSCMLRFEHPLLCDPLYQEMAHESRILNCVSFQNDFNTLSEEGTDHCSLNLMFVTWEARSSESSNISKGFIGVFDLNQWYQAQMPASVKISTDFCSFFGGFSLQEVIEKAAPEFILDVGVNFNSILPFQRLEPHELHFFPSSLAFGVTCLTNGGIINVSYLGLQRQILLDLHKTGSNIFIEPSDALKVCSYGGLIKPMEKNLSTMLQREALLSLCLEHKMFNLINSCASNLGSREFSNTGGPLRFILEWAWKKTGQIKNTVDRLILPLFNQTNIQLDALQHREFIQYISFLDHLAMILRGLCTHSIAVTQQGFRELEAKTNAITLIHTYYRIVAWFYQIGLISLRKEDGSGESFEIPFDHLKDCYRQRRRDLQKISSLIRGTNLLLIDGMVTHVGDQILNLWEKDGGNTAYPPSCLYSLVNMFLLDDVPMVTKHKIMLYFLLDAASSLSGNKQDQISTELMSYISTFSIPPSLVRITRGFWLLDHRDFNGAIPLLTHPFVKTDDIELWQHTVIIKSLLYQGEHQNALRYWECRQPNMSSPEDMKLYLSVLLVNELIMHAYQFQSRCRDKNVAKDLLNHFFLGCLQTKHLKDVIELPLTDQEQNSFIDFLKASDEQHAQDILVMYFLQRGQFQHAFQLNEKLKCNNMTELDPSRKNRNNIRNQIVDGYVKILPKVQQQLITNSNFSRVNILNDEKSVPKIKPQPLSTLIKPSNMEIVSQATLIEAVLEKINETTSEMVGDASPSINQERRKLNFESSEQAVPFLCTPITPKHGVQRAMNEVYYPIVKESETQYVPSEMMGSPSKRSRFIEISPPSKRHNLKHINAELTSMLQMPPLRRKTPQRSSVASTSEMSYVTPQSILKIRNLTQGSSRSSPSLPSDIKILTMSSERTPINQDLSVDVLPKPSSPTAKQLRFAEPDSPEESLDEIKNSPIEMSSFHETGIILSSPLEAIARRPLHSTNIPSPDSSTPITLSEESEFSFSAPLETSPTVTTKPRSVEVSPAKSTQSETTSQDQSDDDTDEMMSASTDDYLELNFDASDTVSVTDVHEDELGLKRSNTRVSTCSSVASWHSASSTEAIIPEERPGSTTPTWIMDIMEREPSFGLVQSVKTAQEEAEKISPISLPEEPEEKAQDRTLTLEQINEDVVQSDLVESTGSPIIKQTPSVRRRSSASKPPKSVRSERRTSLRLSAKKNPVEIEVGDIEKVKKVLNMEEDDSPKTKEKRRPRSRLSVISESSQSSVSSTPVKGEKPKKTRKSKKRTDLEEIQFSFSEPDVLPTADLAPLEDLDTTPTQEVKPFIFSPPLTRSKSKKVKPKAEAAASAKSEKGSPKRASMKKGIRIRKHHSPEVLVSNSPINFISPAPTSGQAYSLRSKDVGKIRKTKTAVKLQKKM